MIISEAEKNRIRKLHREYSIIKEQTSEWVDDPDYTWDHFWEFFGLAPEQENNQHYTESRESFWNNYEGQYCCAIFNEDILGCSPTLKAWADDNRTPATDTGYTVIENDAGGAGKTSFENTVNLQEVIACYNKFNTGEASFAVRIEKDTAVPSIKHDYRTK